MKSKQTNLKKAGQSVHRTPAKPASRRHSRAEAQLKTILQATTECYGTWNPASGPIEINESLLQMLGFSGDNSLNGRVFLQSLMRAQDRSAFEAQVKAHRAGATTTLDSEFRLRTKGGLFRWFALRGKTIRRDRRGASVEIAYAVRDIHAVKERQLRDVLDAKQQKQALQGSRERLTAILQASEQSISVVDPVEFRLLEFNHAFEELILRAHGVRPMIGLRPADLAPESADAWSGLYRKVLAEGKISQDYVIHSLNETHQLHGERLVTGGRVWGVCVCGYDVTDRKRAEQALRKSEEKFANAFRHAPLAIALVSLRDHRYLDVNDAFAEATGNRREDLIGKAPFELWTNPEQRKEIVREAQLAGEVQNVELNYRTVSGEIRQAMGSVVLIEIDEEPCMLVVVSDITERKRALEALQESEERLRIAIDAGHMYAFEWDTATDILERSKQSIPMLELVDDGSGLTKQEMIERILPEDRERYLQALQHLTPKEPDYKTIFRFPRQDGRTAWLEESGRAIFAADGKLRKVIGITADVTEVRESERTLRELSSRLITSQEEERRRIARELHDHVGQEAALICVQAQRLDSGVAEQEGTARSDIHELYKKIKSLATDVSKLSHRLHSSELTFLGLSVAAERLCSDFASQYGIDVDFRGKSIPPTLDATKSLCFYRVLQEALQNVVKHSHASRVIVELQTIENELIMKVRDNGKGFDVQRTGSGLGLMSMRERLNFVGGQFGITCRPGSGATVTAQVAV